MGKRRRDQTERKQGLISAISFLSICLILLSALTSVAMSQQANAGQTTNSLAGVILEQTTQTPTSTRFVPSYGSLGTLPSPRFPIDVKGRVVRMDGSGMPGVKVRVVSEGGWEAYASTDSSGNFGFTLTEGKFGINLMGLVHNPAFIDVDGKNMITVEFREVGVAAPTSTFTIPPIPTTAATNTPARTTTGTPSTPTTTGTPSTPTTGTPSTPTTTGTPPTPTSTPDEMPTLKPSVETPAVVAQLPTATPRPKSAQPTFTARPLFEMPQISLTEWVRPFIIGGGITALLFIIGILIAILRR